MKNDEEEEMAIDSPSELFKLSDITEAIKNSNFNKGLGPDCFDGNILQLDELSLWMRSTKGIYLIT